MVAVLAPFLTLDDDGRAVATALARHIPPTRLRATLAPEPLSAG
jgi:hypothetical protein